MDNDDIGPTAGSPVPDPQAELLKAHIEAGKARMLDGGAQPQDSFLFLSAPHEAMPKLAFLDPILDPVDKTVWANIWIHAKEQGAQNAGFPSHRILMSRCNIRQRSKIIRSITMLRLCRWVTLCEQVRDTGTGKFRGNIYALHDEPATLALTHQLDADYMAFLGRCLRHKDGRIRRVAANISENIDHELLRGRDLLTHDPIYQHERRLASIQAILAREKDKTPHLQGDGKRPTFFSWLVEPLLESKDTGGKRRKKHQVQKPDTVNHRVQNLHTVVSDPKPPKSPSPKSEHGDLAVNHHVQNSEPGDFERSSSSSIFLEKTSTTNAGGKNHHEDKKQSAATAQPLIAPTELTRNEYALALRRIQKMPLDEQQNLLDELGEQIRQRKDTSNPVRNPIGYLNWLCQQLEQGKQPLSSAHLNRQERRRREAAHQAAERAAAAKANEELARLSEELAQNRKMEENH